MNKPELRLQCKEARLKLTQAEVESKSQAIVEQLKGAVDWASISAMHCFLPMKELNEVDTTGLLEFIWQQFPLIATYTTPKDKPGEVYEVKTGFALSKASFTPRFDVVIVPMLGFDSRLHRLGYGKGHYDRFLTAHPRAQKIGVCFELGRLQSIPAEPHDIKLDVVVTELSQ